MVVQVLYSEKDTTADDPLDRLRHWYKKRTRILKLREQPVTLALCLSEVVKLCLDTTLFRVMIIVLILVNTLLSACTLEFEWMAQQMKVHTIQPMQNGIMMVYFVECTLKIFAMKAEYFDDGWNIFDFFLVIISLPVFLPSDVKFMLLRTQSAITALEVLIHAASFVCSTRSSAGK